jgi:hypothetical protein
MKRGRDREMEGIAMWEGNVEGKNNGRMRSRNRREIN